MIAFIAVLKKDILAELRLKESLIIGSALALVLSGLCAFGLEHSGVDQRNIALLFPLLTWIIFLFSATISFSRAFEYEFSGAALEGLLLTNISTLKVFISKLLVYSLIALVIHLVSIISLLMLLNVQIKIDPIDFSVLSLLVILGYSSLSLLFSGMVQASRLKSAMLPLMLFPMLFPIFFAAERLTSQLIIEQSLNFSSAWFSVLLGADVIYLALALNLFEYVAKENP